MDKCIHKSELPHTFICKQGDYTLEQMKHEHEYVCE